MLDRPRVLVVDDDQMVARMIARALTSTCAVSLADDALDVLVRAADFDVIISDLDMPGMSGLMLMKALHAAHPHLSTRLVLVTGHTLSGKEHELLVASGASLLEKPFSLDQLLEICTRGDEAALQ
jgi:CheY-like chemotaxis protein